MSKTQAQQRKTKAKLSKVAQTVAWKKERFGRRHAMRHLVRKVLDNIEVHTTKTKKKDRGFLAKVGSKIASFFGKRSG